MFKRKYRLKRVKLACYNKNRFKREAVLFRRFPLKSDFLDESRSHHTHQQANTHADPAADTMPCAAGRRCQGVPDARPAWLHESQMQRSLRAVPPCQLWCGGPVWRSEMHRICDLPRHRDIRSGVWEYYPISLTIQYYIGPDFRKKMPRWNLPLLNRSRYGIVYRYLDGAYRISARSWSTLTT